MEQTERLAKSQAEKKKNVDFRQKKRKENPKSSFFPQSR